MAGAVQRQPRLQLICPAEYTAEGHILEQMDGHKEGTI